jgi:SAM-dependent methyltransferase
MEMQAPQINRLIGITSDMATNPLRESPAKPADQEQVILETQLDLADEYRQRFAALAPYRQSVWKILVSEYFQQFVAADAVVLDLGAGWGEFIGNVISRRRMAMDLNPEMPMHVGDGVETLLQDCSQTWKINDASLDVVFTSNFFEHLPDKDALRRTLREAMRCLKPGGMIICLGPNIRYIRGEYWDFWDHYVPLSDRSLSEILGLTGFTVERCIPRFLPYSMSLGFAPPAALISLYLRCRFLWPLFGKQFLVIGRKKS